MTKEINIYVALDASGACVTALDEEQLADSAADYLDYQLPHSRFHLKLTVPLPKTTVVTGTVPDEAGGEVKLTVQ